MELVASEAKGAVCEASNARWLAWIVLAGCFDPRPPVGVPCSATSPCPGGQQCIGGTCDGIDQPDPPDPPPADATVLEDALPPGGSGDTCETAIPIALDAQMVAGTLAGANDNYNPPMLCGSDGVEVIYVFDVPQGGASISMRVTPSGWNGRYYVSTSCPPVSVSQCGEIAENGGGATGATYDAGSVFLVIEREAGSGTTFTIRP